MASESTQRSGPAEVGVSAETGSPESVSAHPASPAAARDAEIRHYISALIDEEHRLERSHTGHSLDAAERARLDQLGIELDRCWDLLRQREARRSAGLNPDDATVRDASVVENYRQ